ncbi:hypothetical protein OIU84_007160 [Salix udensis]|uniref:4-coumarate--CoA ligase n=1 Tax=Salix udensis TaxID=889485 RepID=A0AAD6NZ38_9ROSI|nr:hypothetical protein OIU84_007160 [Salix udensis]
MELVGLQHIASLQAKYNIVHATTHTDRNKSTERSSSSPSSLAALPHPKKEWQSTPRSGFCHETKTFHSLRPPTPFPPPHQPLSTTQFVLSLLHSSTIPTITTTYLTIPSTAQSLTYSQAIDQIYSLSSSLKNHYKFKNNDVAFILCPPSIHVPILYLSLLFLGVTISPANPLSSDSELALQIQLCKPKVAFATSQTAHKLPSLPLGTILIDSPEFNSLLTHSKPQTTHPQVEVSQSDVAAILYSSGTTGRVKGVALTHRNLIALISGFRHSKAVLDPNQPELPPVSLFILPLFHVFGFFMSINMFSRGGTLVLMERFEFVHMLKYVERYRITYMPVSPPLIVAFVKEDLTRKYDLSSLKTLGCGGAPLGKEVADAFKEKFPHVEIVQGYGLTETGGGATRTIGPEESSHLASVGRLSENMEAKIVDPETGEALGSWPERGAMVARANCHERLWDLCYFDSEGFLYIVDRLKELIKYKAYQVPPAELEKLLQSIPEIADAAVIPYPDEEAGQIPMAYVVRKPGSNTTEGQIMDSIAKQVSFWIFVETMV